jgi:hypothetical protein
MKKLVSVLFILSLLTASCTQEAIYTKFLIPYQALLSNQGNKAIKDKPKVSGKPNRKFMF